MWLICFQFYCRFFITASFNTFVLISVFINRNSLLPKLTSLKSTLFISYKYLSWLLFYDKELNIEFFFLPNYIIHNYLSFSIASLWIKSLSKLNL